MTASTERAISLVQAARTLFGTKTPTNEQVYLVLRLMKSGTLPGCDGGKSFVRWTTTEAALAEFMAASQLEQETRRGARSRVAAEDGKDARSGPGQRRSAALQNVYRSIWRDYFLGLMLHRRIAHRSVAFHRAVVAGQTLLLLTLVGAALGTVRQVARRRAVPREYRAIEGWIQRDTDDFAVEDWHPANPNADGEGVVVGVAYRYRKGSRRWIHTERTFLVVGDEVSELVLDE